MHAAPSERWPNCSTSAFCPGGPAAILAEAVRIPPGTVQPPLTPSRGLKSPQQAWHVWEPRPIPLPSLLGIYRAKSLEYLVRFLSWAVESCYLPLGGTAAAADRGSPAPCKLWKRLSSQTLCPFQRGTSGCASPRETHTHGEAATDWLCGNAVGASRLNAAHHPAHMAGTLLLPKRSHLG